LPLSGVALLALSRLPGTTALLSALLVFGVHIVCHEKSSMQSTDESALQIFINSCILVASKQTKVGRVLRPITNCDQGG
jgi:hypothetical protein